MIKKIKNKISNEKGFTLIELLVVISIIAILFVTLLPQIDFAGDRARQAGVKTDFHTFQIAAEAYLRETAGEGSGAAGLRYHELNKYLDINMQLSTTVPAGYATGDVVSAKQDPWGQQYAVRIYAGNGSGANQRKIEVYSFGKSELRGTAGTGVGDFKMATYYKQGQTGTCTVGFDNNNLVAHPNLLTNPPATLVPCANGLGTVAPTT